ncbi:MAG: 3-phosphoshikimate 1-carboxyvinyltransferase [Clostridiales bacterium]|nr:3-phosphoshikimate 1-carboxyvinyltransferase [Clostridiales bacterium]
MNIKIIPTKLEGTIDAIPSKSHAHRVLIAQKLAQLQGQNKQDALMIPAFSEDIEATKNCLVQLDKEMPFLDCRESGSTLRFIMPVAMALKEEAIFMGTGKLPHRPLSPLKEEMESHGCIFYPGNGKQKVSDKYKEICTIAGRLQPGEYSLAGNISSQFISGLLLALPLLDGDSLLELTTTLESAGYVDLTLDVLRDFGIEIKESKSRKGFKIYEIKGNQRYMEPDNMAIEGDWSNAAFWLACGALGGDVTCRGLSLSSSQRDKEIVGVLEDMGAEISITDNDDVASMEICCRGNVLHAMEVNVAQTPDIVPVLASVMSLAKGSSIIANAGRLKIKESNRLETVFNFLLKLGADITYGGESLSITGLTSLKGGEAEGYNDHRIVMAAAVASCGCQTPVIIKGAEAVKKSYPDFFNDFASLGGEVYKTGESGK